MKADGPDHCPATAQGIRAAAARLKGHVVRTPIIENDVLNEIAKGRIFLKAEVLQKGGSFKFRGAYNLISQLSDDERAKGVVAWSSGNHAQGIARAAFLLGVEATIVMPADTPAIKVEGVHQFGAEIVSYDRYQDDREEIAREIQARTGKILAPSFDHIDIIEGQGTLALETCDQLSELGLMADNFVVCCGGGGLTSGCAVYLADAAPETKVMIAEPEGFDETWRSIETGVRQRADVSRKTICDAIATPTPGRLTLPIMSQWVRAGFSVSENDVADAVQFAFKYLKLAVEPGGAVALAAVLKGLVPTDDRLTLVTLSGGNIDPERLAEFVNGVKNV